METTKISLQQCLENGFTVRIRRPNKIDRHYFVPAENAEIREYTRYHRGTDGKSIQIPRYGLIWKMEMEEYSIPQSHYVFEDTQSTMLRSPEEWLDLVAVGNAVTQPQLF